MTYLIATFYKFVNISDLEAKKKQILALCCEKQIKGTIILAEEGINATIAGTNKAIADVLKTLRS